MLHLGSVPVARNHSPCHVLLIEDHQGRRGERNGAFRCQPELHIHFDIRRESRIDAPNGLDLPETKFLRKPQRAVGQSLRIRRIEREGFAFEVLIHQSGSRIAVQVENRIVTFGIGEPFALYGNVGDMPAVGLFLPFDLDIFGRKVQPGLSIGQSRAHKQRHERSKKILHFSGSVLLINNQKIQREKLRPHPLRCGRSAGFYSSASIVSVIFFTCSFEPSRVALRDTMVAVYSPGLKYLNV